MEMWIRVVVPRRILPAPAVGSSEIDLSLVHLTHSPCGVECHARSTRGFPSLLQPSHFRFYSPLSQLFPQNLFRVLVLPSFEFTLTGVDARFHDHVPFLTTEVGAR
jgi:hypothetical protein